MRRTSLALCLSTALLSSALPIGSAAALAPAAEESASAVTPLAPGVTDECGIARDVVTIPEVDGVRYLYDIGDETLELTAGDYATLLFTLDPTSEEVDLEELIERGLPDARATIRAVPAEGHTLADGAPTSFDITSSSTPCESTALPVTARSETCATVTFTNPAGNPDVLILFGDPQAWEPEGEVTLRGGASATVDIDGESVDYIALPAEEFIGWTADEPQAWSLAGPRAQTSPEETLRLLAPRAGRLAGGLAERLDAARSSEATPTEVTPTESTPGESTPTESTPGESTPTESADAPVADDSAADDSPAPTEASEIADYVATQDDRDALAEAAEIVDALVTMDDLGEGTVEVDECAATAPHRQPTGGARGGATPVIPAIVQTDGPHAPTGHEVRDVLAPAAGLGLLAAGLLTLRRRFQA